MFDLVLPRGAYSRANGNLPPFVLTNMCAEATPSAHGGVSLISLPGLLSSTTVGDGPINGMFRKADLFDGATFTLSGDMLYRAGVSLGAIAGTGPVSWACSSIELVLTRGLAAYSYDGTDLVAIDFPDGANVTAVAFMSGLFLFARAETDRFYWSAVNDGRMVDALDFASAESAPDGIRDILAQGDTLAHGGKETIEFWYPTGNGDLPFARTIQRTASVGIAATGTLVDIDNAPHFVGSDRVVYREAEVPVRISDHGIEEQLSNSSTFLCFTYLWQGHKILCVRLDTVTLCYDVTTSQWHERTSWGLTNWRARCAIQQADGSPLFGSADTSDLLIYSGWQDLGSPYVREFTAAIPLTSTAPVDKVEIEANTGAADLTVPNPLIEMRSSRDGGKTFRGWRSKSLGATGHYRTRPRWKRNGYFDAPGALFQFRVSDAVPLRVSGATGNEGSAGRSR